MTTANEKIIKTGLIHLDHAIPLYEQWIKDDEKNMEKYGETLRDYFEGMIHAQKRALNKFLEIKEDFILFCQQMEEETENKPRGD